MYILHQYHKASGLKLMCRNEKMEYVIYINIYVFLRGGGGGWDLLSWKNMKLLRWNTMEKHELIFIILLCTPEYNFLCDPTRQHKSEGKYFYKLIRSKGWQHASWVQTQNSTIQRITTNLMQKRPKWNEITQLIWLWVYQEQFVILSVNQGLAINFTWAALKNKQRFELFEVFLTSADQLFFFFGSFFYLHLYLYLYLKTFAHKVSDQ